MIEGGSRIDGYTAHPTEYLAALILALLSGERVPSSQACAVRLDFIGTGRSESAEGKCVHFFCVKGFQIDFPEDATFPLTVENWVVTPVVDVFILSVAEMYPFDMYCLMLTQSWRRFGP